MNVQYKMWVVEVYRSAREIVSVWNDVKDLYDMVVEIYKKREDVPPEIELTTRFRECCGMAHEDEPLFFFLNPRLLSAGGKSDSEECKQAVSSAPRPMATFRTASSPSLVFA